jgi:tetratricopeptide (TPR) repeat protein
MKTKPIISITGTLIFFLASCSPSTEELYTKADKLIDKKKYTKAIEVYDKIIKRHFKFQDAYFEKGFCYLQDSNYTEALHFFEIVLVMKGLNKESNFIFEENADSPFASEEAKHQVSLGEIFYEVGITKYYMDSLVPSYINFQNAIDHNYDPGNCFAWQGVIWTRYDSLEKACNFFRRSKLLGEPDADRLLKLYCEKSVVK